MIPKYNEVYKEILDILKDENEHTFKEIKEIVADMLHLSLEERIEKLDSGKIKYADRINWACTYLKKAELIKNTKRGILVITERGLSLIKSNPKIIDNNTLSNYKEFVDFTKRTKKDEKNINNKVIPDNENQTPQDIFEKSFEDINKILEEDILEEVLRQSPDFFEHMVIKLLNNRIW